VARKRDGCLRTLAGRLTISGDPWARIQISLNQSISDMNKGGTQLPSKRIRGKKSNIHSVKYQKMQCSIHGILYLLDSKVPTHNFDLTLTFFLWGHGRWKGGNWPIMCLSLDCGLLCAPYICPKHQLVPKVTFYQLNQFWKQNEWTNHKQSRLFMSDLQNQ